MRPIKQIKLINQKFKTKIKTPSTIPHHLSTIPIMFKTLHHKQPSYLAELLTPRHDTSHNTRSSDSPNCLSVPQINSECGRRSFLYAAPTIWNSLPDSLLASVSVSSFLSGLKTHLFPP